MQGVLVKDYRIINAIGEGGMATVYLAEHQLLGNRVAIKILHDEFVRNKNIRNRFIAEAKNMARMSHQNIIKVTDLVDDGDLVAFVMEYIEGQTLKQYLDAKGKLSDEEIKKLFVQMLDAVGYVHEQGLVHRDIKPSNFIISGKEVVKLLDFGIAKNMDVNSSEYTITDTRQTMGTPMYMSPEQIKSTKDVTHQSDIYSLGVVLWQMVSGRRPYDSSTLSNFEIHLKIVQEQLLELNSPWDAVILKATEKKEQSRYVDSSDFLMGFLRVCQNSEYFTEKTFIENSDSLSNNTELNHGNAIEKIIQYLKSGEEDWELISTELQDLFQTKSQLWANFNQLYPVNSKKRDSLLSHNKLELKFLEEVIDFIYEKNIIKRGMKFIPLSYKIVYYKLKFIKKDDIINELWGD